MRGSEHPQSLAVAVLVIALVLAALLFLASWGAGPVLPDVSPDPLTYTTTNQTGATP